MHDLLIGECGEYFLQIANVIFPSWHWEEGQGIQARQTVGLLKSVKERLSQKALQKGNRG